MHLGLVGLGKMGGNMRTRLRNAGHTVVGYDRNPDLADVDSLAAMVEALPSPKVVWVMVPAGEPTRGMSGRLVRVRLQRYDGAGEEVGVVTVVDRLRRAADVGRPGPTERVRVVDHRMPRRRRRWE